MALKSTVFKLHLNVADLDRQVYGDFPLTLARHPSETDQRMMLRVLAFALHADPQLAFGRGISTDDEPDLWQRRLDGEIEHWIELGTPDPDRLRRACGRARQVWLYCYGDRATPVWWNKHGASLARHRRLTVAQIPDSEAQGLAALARPGLTLQCTISEGEAMFTSDDGSVTLHPVMLQDGGA